MRCKYENVCSSLFSPIASANRLHQILSVCFIENYGSYEGGGTSEDGPRPGGCDGSQRALEDIFGGSENENGDGRITKTST